MPDIQEDVRRAQADQEEMNRLIKENKRFIMACAYRTVNHFVTESDDEWSVAMIAFHEAVCSYQEEKGDFRLFASMVIRRRLLDYIRSEARHAGEIPVEPYSMDGELEPEEDATPLQLELLRRNVEQSRNAADSLSHAPTLKDEIAALKEILDGYGFSFFDLADCSPKAAKTKSSCAKAVVCLLEDDGLFRRMRETGSLPMKEIQSRSGVAKKILERHRRYIIAAAEILNGEYPLLAEYMNYIRKALDP